MVEEAGDGRRGIKIKGAGAAGRGDTGRVWFALIFLSSINFDH